MKRARPLTDTARQEVRPWRATLAGLCATLVGIGLARFAYTPLIPALIEARWFSAADVVYLGAANLAGYLAGALLARPMAARIATPLVLRAMMLLACACAFACALPLSVLWFFLWRFASGVSGGVLMVLAASSVMPLVPAARQGIAGGVIFTGVGLGIVLSGTLVPLLLSYGLVETWIGLGALSLILTLIAWHGWPSGPPRGAQPTIRPRLRPSLTLKAVYAEYALVAMGLVPHMVFLVDFVVRGLGESLERGAGFWVLFGFGAMVGPVLAGHLGDRVGFRVALRLSLVVQAAAVGAVAFVGGTGALVVSSLIIGAFVPGIVPLVLGRVRELAPAEAGAQTTAWSLATAAFALGQAGAAYGFSYLFTGTANYLLLFQLASGSFLLALVIDLLVARDR
ncbi:MAG: YbfB/YjiJ family MFS transporter [Pseudomonadota bacterium]